MQGDFRVDGVAVGTDRGLDSAAIYGTVRRKALLMRLLQRACGKAVTYSQLVVESNCFVVGTVKLQLQQEVCKKNGKAPSKSAIVLEGSKKSSTRVSRFVETRTLIFARFAAAPAAAAGAIAASNDV